MRDELGDYSKNMKNEMSTYFVYLSTFYLI